jgi:hypothetical protein
MMKGPNGTVVLDDALFVINKTIAKRATPKQANIVAAIICAGVNIPSVRPDKKNSFTSPAPKPPRAMRYRTREIKKEIIARPTGWLKIPKSCR